MLDAIAFKGKTIMVTGAAKGLGLGIAREFARHGGDIMMLDIDGKALQKAAVEVAGLGGEVLALSCDVSKREDLEKAFAAIDEFTGRLDVCVPNAGIIRTGNILELSEEDYDAVMGVNLKGVFLTSQMAARRMVAQKEAGDFFEGSIIPMSSANAVVAIPNQLAYVSSKGGVTQMTKAMALALAPHNIRVNAIGPGSVMSDVLKAVAHDERAQKMILSRTPMRRIGEPEEIGRIAVFLASNYASYMTGQTIFPEGGRLSLNYTVPVAD